MDTRKNFFPEKVVNLWNRLPKELVEFLFLQVEHVDVAHRDKV